jgi:hypothetical protein
MLTCYILVYMVMLTLVICLEVVKVIFVFMHRITERLA